MKRYYNETTKAWYTEGNSLTIYTDKGLFSGVPTEEMLAELGYKEYIEPTPEPLTEEQIKLNAKHARMNEILAELKSMDYLTSKYIDGEDMSDYGDWQEKRIALRKEYNELEVELNKLNEDE